MFVNGAWVDFQPGMIQFNPRGNVHGHRQAGPDPLVFISIFTPPRKNRIGILWNKSDAITPGGAALLRGNLSRGWSMTGN